MRRRRVETMRALVRVLLLPLAAAAAQEPPAPTSEVQLRAIGENYKSTAGAPRRPTGPVTVTADRAEWQQAGLMHYSGHVQLSVDTLDMHGDNLELKQFGDGLYEAHLTGEPARLNDSGKDGAPPVTAQARKLDYDARTAVVELNGGAVLTRGTDNLTGESIRYDVTARRVQAAGGSGGQVRIVIQPPPEKDQGSANPEKDHSPEKTGP